MIAPRFHSITPAWYNVHVLWFRVEPSSQQEVPRAFELQAGVQNSGKLYPLRLRGSRRRLHHGGRPDGLLREAQGQAPGLQVQGRYLDQAGGRLQFGGGVVIAPSPDPTYYKLEGRCTFPCRTALYYIGPTLDDVLQALRDTHKGHQAEWIVRKGKEVVMDFRDDRMKEW